MKALSNMKRLQVSSEYLLLLLQVYEAKGKAFYYDELFERDKDVFLKKTIEDNLFYLSKILNFELTDSRLKLIAKKKVVAKNKTEVLVNNIKNSLSSIQKYPKSFELLTNEFDELAKMLSKDFEPIKFSTFEGKQDQTIFSEKKKESRRTILDNLILEFNKQSKTKNYETIQLIVNFYVDYINQHIFTQYNEIISYIILYAFLLLEFSVFKYVSFFELLFKTQKRYDLSITNANYYYDTGYPNTDELAKFIVELLNEAYDKVNQLSKEYSFEKKLNKGDSIEYTIKHGKEIFSKEDIRLSNPTISMITIDRTLKRLKDEGLIQPLGKGRSSKWQRLDENRRKGGEQLDIFHYTESWRNF